MITISDTCAEKIGDELVKNAAERSVLLLCGDDEFVGNILHAAKKHGFMDRGEYVFIDVHRCAMFIALPFLIFLLDLSVSCSIRPSPYYSC